MKDIVIVGTGGLGREVLGLLLEINKVKVKWNIKGFYDDFTEEKKVNDYPVLGTLKDLKQLKDQISAVVAIGNPKIKKEIIKDISKSNIQYPILIHPSVVLYSEKYITLGEGVVIGANSVLTTNIDIEKHVYINTAVVVAHDNHIKSYSMLMPTVAISAGAVIGESVYVGNGVKIDASVEIPNNLKIPAGTIITSQKDVEKL